MQEEYSPSYSQTPDTQTLGGAFLGGEGDIYIKAAKKMKKVITGIYAIKNPLGQTYIGSSIDIDYRWSQYKKTQKQQHKISASISEYGYENHDFSLLEVCNADLLDELEIYHKTCFVDVKGWENSLFYYLDDKREFADIQRKPVFQYHLDGSFVVSFDGVRDAARKTGISSSSIARVALKKRKSTGGFQWSYEKVVRMPKIKKQAGRKTIVQQIKKGKVIAEFGSTTKAAKLINGDPSSIGKAARGLRKSASGFQWAYKELNTNKL
tara:strand:- start:48 stop:845 length:798 start_codon:yes stop_codon:yes gene_type:complete